MFGRRVRMFPIKRGWLNEINESKSSSGNCSRLADEIMRGMTCRSLMSSWASGMTSLFLYFYLMYSITENDHKLHVPLHIMTMTIKTWRNWSIVSRTICIMSLCNWAFFHSTSIWGKRMQSDVETSMLYLMGHGSKISDYLRWYSYS